MNEVERPSDEELTAIEALPGFDRYPCGTKWLCYWAANAGQTAAEYLREYLAETDLQSEAR